MVRRLVPLAPLLVLSALLTGPAAAQDYSGYRVLTELELDLRAGPASRAVLLSPDGLLAISNHDDLCIWATATIGAWGRRTCVDGDVHRLRRMDDMMWSPDSGALLMPTFAEIFLYMRDTDVSVLDATDLTLTVLTEDGIDRSPLDSDTPAFADTTTRWLDADTIAFVRFGFGGDSDEQSGHWIMAIDADGSNEGTLVDLPGRRGTVYALAASPDGTRISYAVDGRLDSSMAGLYVFEIGSDGPDRVADVGELAPMGIAFSADGSMLLTTTRNRLEGGVIAEAVDIETGEVVAITVDGEKVSAVGWAPTGTGLVVTTVGTESEAVGGIYLSNGPGEPMVKVSEGNYLPPVCCGDHALTWADNDTIVLSTREESKAVYLWLGGDRPTEDAESAGGLFGGSGKDKS